MAIAILATLKNSNWLIGWLTDRPTDWLTEITYYLLTVLHLFCAQNILNNHDEDESGHEVIVTALERMMDVTAFINELKRQHERDVRKDELRSSLASGGGVDMDIVGFGELILEVGLYACYKLWAFRVVGQHGCLYVDGYVRIS